VIKQAETLAEAKAKFADSLKQFCSRVKLSASKCSKMLKIAEQASRLEALLGLLPSAWTTLYELASLDEADFRRVTRHALFGPTMTRDEVGEVLKGEQPKNRGDQPDDASNDGASAENDGSTDGSIENPPEEGGSAGGSIGKRVERNPGCIISFDGLDRLAKYESHTKLIELSHACGFKCIFSPELESELRALYDEAA
jgi:hypothetical protein